MHNGGYLFLWVSAWGSAIGKSLPPARLPGLLKVALRLAAEADRTLPAPSPSPSPSATPTPTPASLPPTVPPERPATNKRSAPDRAIPALVVLAWGLAVGAFFLPASFSPVLLTLPALVLAFIGLDLRRVGATCHFAVLAGCILAASLATAQGVLCIPLGFAAIIVIDWFASSRNTHRDPQGRLLWGHRDEA
jgi:hypothetical protein